MGSAINDQQRHLQLRVQALQQEDDRRKFADNAKQQVTIHRYDKFEDNRDRVMSKHYQEVIAPKREYLVREGE